MEISVGITYDEVGTFEPRRYSTGDEADIVVSVDEETVKRWERVLGEYARMQAELDAFVVREAMERHRRMQGEQ